MRNRRRLRTAYTTSRNLIYSPRLYLTRSEIYSRNEVLKLDNRVFMFYFWKKLSEISPRIHQHTSAIVQLHFYAGGGGDGLMSAVFRNLEGNFFRALKTLHVFLFFFNRLSVHYLMLHL